MDNSRQPVDRASLLSRDSLRSINFWLVIMLIVLTAVLIVQSFSKGSQQPSGGSRIVTPRGDLAAGEQSTIAVFEQTSPSVVFIRAKGYRRALFGQAVEQELSSGSGFVWDERGHVVTNMHVVIDVLQRGESASLEVQFADDRVLDARIVGGVFEHDIAVLQVLDESQTYQPITLGESSELRVGQTVLAIGNPFGFDQTLSTGVIGGLNRTVTTSRTNELLSGLIQTDAAINPGNSGGPLLDSAGRLIGVNTAIVSPTGAYSGLGFAVPVDSVVESVDRVLQQANGQNSPELLGAAVLSRDAALQIGVPEEVVNQGLVVSQVIPNSAAHDAGLQAGDVIAAVDGERVADGPELRALIESHAPGDVIELTVIRRNQTGRIQVQLRERKWLF